MRWILLVVVCSVPARAYEDNALQRHYQPASKVWVGDNGDGTYRNPILHADYSDPDAIRVGDDFYMTSSSFNCVPGLPILHSKDLVNWTLVGHALARQVPAEVFDKPQHGNGCWAPAIRHRKGQFYIYYPDPDTGIWLVKARDPAGPWDAPVLVAPGKGLIDPCPLWDDDGKAYLVHAWAGSRAGVNGLLTVRKMNPDGTECLDEGVHVFDGHEGHPTVEGPKFYKRNGYYYIFAPAGGVTKGWQLVLRSKDIYGPYESKVVLEQGTTPTNGPHQGAWIETESGQSWFIHFQDKGAYGRIVHLQPVNWIDDWPVMGVDKDGDGKGEPILTFRKPDAKRTHPTATPAESDEFGADTLGPQWQWHANPKVTWTALIRGSGYLRLFAVREPQGAKNLWDVPSLLLQKFPGPDFTATARIKFTPQYEGKRVGLLVMGQDYSYLSLASTGDGLVLAQNTCLGAEKGTEEKTIGEQPVKDGAIYLRVKVASPDAKCQFSFSRDGAEFTPVGDAFTAKPGKWIGAKVGLFCLSGFDARTGGYTDVDWFRVE